jgi:hypothetical protein
MGVSCPTATGCIATGQITQFTGAGEIQAALSEKSNGAIWQQLPMTYANIGVAVRRLLPHSYQLHRSRSA